LEGLAIEDVGIFYGHFVIFTAIRYVLWPVDIFSPVSVYFSPFWYVAPRKSGNPASDLNNCAKKAANSGG
jgi:hypothetical protein